MLRGREFYVPGGHVYAGSDINYIGIGAMGAHYGFTQLRVTSYVTFWNLKDAILYDFGHNMSQIRDGSAWARFGYENSK